MEKVITNFMAAYVPNKNLSVDESMIAFKGSLSWVQYMPKNPTNGVSRRGYLLIQQTAMCGTGSFTPARYRAEMMEKDFLVML